MEKAGVRPLRRWGGVNGGAVLSWGHPCMHVWAMENGNSSKENETYTPCASPSHTTQWRPFSSLDPHHPMRGPDSNPPARTACL